MLISFHVKNFRSIVDTAISLDYAEGKAPNSYKEMDALPFLDAGSAKNRVVPCLALYGANASGKTNLIKAIYEFNTLLKNGIENAFAPNKLHSGSHSTQFRVDFSVNKDLLSYAVEYNREGIIGESLKKNGKTLFSIEKSKIAEAKNIESKFYPISKLEEILKVECSSVSGVQARSFLSKMGKEYAGLNADVSAAASFFLSSVDIFLTNDFPVEMGTDASVDILPKIEEFIRKMDFGIKRMRLDSEKLNLYTYHDDIHGKEVRFDFEEESDGTQTAFGVIGVILSALENGKVVCIDELDRSLHSLVLREIVRLFKDKRYNAKGAQLIFTAHNTDLLDAEILRVSEVGIASKNLAHGTTLTRLSEFQGIRNVLNFRKKYLSGEFSGIPFPYI
jgi:AAA15 family ATPase/GTPase